MGMESEECVKGVVGAAVHGERCVIRKRGTSNQGLKRRSAAARRGRFPYVWIDVGEASWHKSVQTGARPRLKPRTWQAPPKHPGRSAPASADGIHDPRDERYALGRTL